MPKFTVNVDSGVEVTGPDDGPKVFAPCYSEVEISSEEAAPLVESGRLIPIAPPPAPPKAVGKPQDGDE
jgi:hypothetical protein